MMEQYILKSAVVAEINRIEYETNYEPFTDEVFGKRKVCKDIKDFLDTLEVKEVDLEDSVKETLAQKYIDYTFRRHNIDPESKEGQLIYYAYMHGMNQCLTQLRT